MVKMLLNRLFISVKIIKLIKNLNIVFLVYARIIGKKGKIHQN